MKELLIINNFIDLGTLWGIVTTDFLRDPSITTNQQEISIYRNMYQQRFSIDEIRIYKIIMSKPDVTIQVL